MNQPKHRGTQDSRRELDAMHHREQYKDEARERAGMPPRLHMCANAPKHAHLWTRGIEMTLPRHRAPQHVDPVAYAALLATPRGGRF